MNIDAWTLINEYNYKLYTLVKSVNLTPQEKSEILCNVICYTISTLGIIEK